MFTSASRAVLARLGRSWRFAITGLCFAGFSVGSCILGLTIFPTLWLLPGGAAGRRQRARWLIHKAFGLMVGVLRVGGVMRLEIEGAHTLIGRSNALILANHPTLLDVVVLLAVIPDATCVVKSRLWHRRFVGAPLRAAGYIPNDEPERFINASADALLAGGTLLIFPEGTRSDPGAPFQFQRGAAYIALSSRAEIVPVVIACDPLTLTKRHKWYDIPARAFCLSVSVKPARPLSAWTDGRFEATPAGARRLTHSLESYFMQEMRS
jgi:1-acyl-sn-glycerol-3-phosphate acyltransferase